MNFFNSLFSHFSKPVPTPNMTPIVKAEQIRYIVSKKFYRHCIENIDMK